MLFTCACHNTCKYVVTCTYVRMYIRMYVLTLHVRTYTRRFLDKLYCLSSVDALMDFTRCPRRYLLDPLPMIPCKICIVGPPLSGKTTLAAQIANHYQAEVINVWELVTLLQEKAKQENIAKVEAEETAKAISLISNKLKGTCIYIYTYVCTYVCTYMHAYVRTYVIVTICLHSSNEFMDCHLEDGEFIATA